MGVPLQISAKGVEYHDETGSKVHGLILLKKHTGDNTVYSMEETVKERTVIQEKLPGLFVNGKNTMAVGNIDEFKGHRGSLLYGGISYFRRRRDSKLGSNFSRDARVRSIVVVYIVEVLSG